MTAPLPVEDALARILARCHPLPAEAVPLAAAAGRVLAQDRCSDLDLPPFDNSAMDGYAVRLADVAVAPVTLPVQEQIAAGGLTPAPLRSGHIAKIMTGAPIPDGTEAVVPVEATTGGPDQVTIDRPPRPAANIRRAGEDVARGERVVAAGCTLGYAELAVLAAVGCDPVPVTRRPRAVVVSTGDELVPADATPGPGQIRDSSILAIPALLTAAGAEVVRVAHAVDSAAALEALFDDVGNVELVVTCGGVSMGDRDFVRPVFSRRGEVDFWRVAIKPGKPLLCGQLGAALFFGLPGNPVSSMVTADVFVRPAIDALLGRRDGGPVVVTAELTAALRSDERRTEYVRVAATATADGWRATPTGNQSSGRLTSMLGANGYAVLPPGVASVAVGEPVRVELWSWRAGATV